MTTETVSPSAEPRTVFGSSVISIHEYFATLESFLKKPQPQYSDEDLTRSSSIAVSPPSPSLEPPGPALATLIEDSLRVIDEAITRYPCPQLAVSFNGGKDACVMLFLISFAIYRISKGDIDTFKAIHPTLYCFVTQKEFPDELIFIENVGKWLDARVVNIPCQTIREGLIELLDNYPETKGIFLGVRGDDPHGTHCSAFSPTTGDWPAVMRISPILGWNYHSIWQFLLTFSLPYCQLYDKGYTSIGNVEDTSPNPALRNPSGEFLPAYMLTNANQERSGRL